MFSTICRVCCAASPFFFTGAAAGASVGVWTRACFGGNVIGCGVDGFGASFCGEGGGFEAGGAAAGARPLLAGAGLLRLPSAVWARIAHSGSGRSAGDFAGGF